MYDRVFICSPYSGDIERNCVIARALCRKATERGIAPFAPHLVYPQLLNDKDPYERKKGMDFGLAFLEKCDEVWVYDGNGITPGMKKEIESASSIGIPVRFVNLEAE